MKTKEKYFQVKNKNDPEEFYCQYTLIKKKKPKRYTLRRKKIISEEKSTLKGVMASKI